MGKYKTIQEDIENVTNKEVVKQTRISGVAIGLIVAGGLCAVAGKGFEDPNSSMPTFCLHLLHFCFWLVLSSYLSTVVIIPLSRLRAV